MIHQNSDAVYFTISCSSSLFMMRGTKVFVRGVRKSWIMLIGSYTTLEDYETAFDVKVTCVVKKSPQKRRYMLHKNK